MNYKKIILSVLSVIIMVSIGLSYADAATTTPKGKIAPIKKQLDKRDIRNIKIVAKEEIKNIRSSSTPPFKLMKNEKRELVKKMRNDVFEIRKNALLKELGIALGNIIRTKDNLSNRINKAEASGRNVLDAKVALALASEKISQAQTAVNLLANTNFSNSTTTASSTQINLEKPRKIGDDAIRAVKDARDVLKAAVQALAHDMGLATRNATSTLDTTSTTTDDTSSTSTNR